MRATPVMGVGLTVLVFLTPLFIPSVVSLICEFPQPLARLLGSGGELRYAERYFG